MGCGESGTCGDNGRIVNKKKHGGTSCREGDVEKGGVVDDIKDD